MIAAILRMIRRLFRTGKPHDESQRSPLWPRVRAQHLIREPVCQYCEGSVGLCVHHIVPFHLDKMKELDPANLLTLCERAGPEGCHFRRGHRGTSWHDFDPDVRAKCWAHRTEALRQRYYMGLPP